MGLDWNPLARPKPGAEAEYARILATDLGRLGPAQREAQIDRFRQITEAPYEVLGAPRVGLDEEADDWLRDRLRESSREAQFERARAEMHGYYVLDLVETTPGLPVYRPGDYEGVDRYTFRGEFLKDARIVIGDDLLERAWQQMVARDLREYGEQLLASARRYAAEHGLEWLEGVRDPPASGEGDPASAAHIAFSAAAWCTWWSERGFGLEPYF